MAGAKVSSRDSIGAACLDTTIGHRGDPFGATWLRPNGRIGGDGDGAHAQLGVVAGANG